MNRRQYLSTVGTAAVGIVGAAGTASAATGSISVDTHDSGEYSSGDTVNVTVDVTNTGSSPEAFYVGYSVCDPDGNFYDNGNDTDESTEHLASGEKHENLTLSWDVTDEAAVGYYGYVVKLYEDRKNNGDPDEELVGYLDGEDHADENVFEVV